MLKKTGVSGVALCLVLILSAVSCTGHAPSTKINVVVSILPQKYFVERIGGQYVDVTVMVEPGADPHLYTPTPRQVDTLMNSKIYFLSGIEFEGIILDKIRSVLKDTLIVNTVENIRLRIFEQGSHGHEKGIEDPHTWLNPLLVIEQGKVIRNTLEKIDPGHREAYEKNFIVFTNELKALDAAINDLFFGYSGRRFFVFHPAFGYFADAYGLIQVAVEAEGKQAGTRELEQLFAQARADKVKVIFGQPQVSENNVKAVADAIGCKVDTLDVLAYNYEENLLSIAKKIRSSF